METIDHCLECHGEFRTQCIYKSVCKFKSKLKECNNNGFVQLHAHYYHDHNIAIDGDEQEIINRKEFEMNNDERIQYKVNVNISSPGILEFGEPFLVKKKSEATFKNPKLEMLNNSYHQITAVEWNGLLIKGATF